MLAFRKWKSSALLSRVHLKIHAAKPGIIIGRKGVKVNELRRILQELTDKRVKVDVEEIKRPEMDARLVADSIAEQLGSSCFAQTGDAAGGAADHACWRQRYYDSCQRSIGRFGNGPCRFRPRRPEFPATPYALILIMRIRFANHLRRDRYQGLDL